MTTPTARGTAGPRRGFGARIRDRVRTQAALWADLERIAPDPDPFLHWEPTTAGWKLYGRLVPREG